MIAASEASDDYVGFSFWLNPNSAAFTWNQECVALLADPAFVCGGETHSCGHGYFSGS